MKDVQRIAIVDPSDSTREPLRNILLGVESVWLEAECSRYEFFIDVARQSCPDAVVIALDSDHNKALQLIQQLTLEFPHVPILAVSARGDGQSILQALRAGAKEFLTQPVVLEELLQCLSRLRQGLNGDGGTHTNVTPRSESLVVAILGPRGRSGGTSLRNVVRMLHTLGTEDGLGDKVKVVINRVGSEDGEISLKKAEETIGKPVFWQVPNDYKSMLGARNAGVPLIQHAPKSKIHQS